MNTNSHTHCIKCDKHMSYCVGDGDLQCESCYLQELLIKNISNDQEKHQLALIESLVSVVDLREHETSLHSKRVACHTLELARHAGLEDGVCQQIYWGALLHDIGKIAVPDAILLKQGQLSEEEWLLMRSHPELGHRILAPVSFLHEAAKIVLSHEERFDGSGYPFGLSGESIPIGARMVAVIDTLDAITNDRPYRSAMTFNIPRDEIISQSGLQFDPYVVKLFLEKVETMRQMVEKKCLVLSDQSSLFSRL